ncbi:MAG: MBL fold metallo-hydrolase, partial [Fusobacteriaceae bacterium]
MILIPLIENQRNKNFFHEKGLSLYIEFNNKKIIFDTGASNNFIKNAKLLGINLDEIDAVIVSHGHTDHLGGLTNSSSFPKAKIYISEKSFDQFYFCCGFQKNIGIPLDDIFKIKKYENLITINNYQLNEISENIFLFSVPNNKKSKFYFYSENFKEDNFDHEIFLAIKDNNKINIVAGCSHIGV